MIHILNGLTYSSLLFLLASGLSLMFGLMSVINLAHGSYYMMGAYIGYSIVKDKGNFLLAILAGLVAGALCGFVMERFFLRRLHGQYAEQVLLTFGFVYILSDLSRWIWGGESFLIAKPSILAGSVAVGDLSFPVYNLVLIATGIIVVLGLWLFQEKTIAGRIVRAGVDNKEMAMALGINITATFTVVFTFGAALAGFAGIMGGPIIGAYAGVDLHILLLALVVVVVGGLGTFRGALFGSLLIGFISTLSRTWLPEFSMFSIFVAMSIILLVKPSGLFGRR
jgi:branched-chain amino acid transport system permease protein